MIAIGLNDGRVLLHNVKYDETVVHFKQDWGPVTCLAFRTGKTKENTLKISLIIDAYN